MYVDNASSWGDTISRVRSGARWVDLEDDEFGSTIDARTRDKLRECSEVDSRHEVCAFRCVREPRRPITWTMTTSVGSGGLASKQCGGAEASESRACDLVAGNSSLTWPSDALLASQLQRPQQLQPGNGSVCPGGVGRPRVGLNSVWACHDDHSACGFWPRGVEMKVFSKHCLN